MKFLKRLRRAHSLPVIAAKRYTATKCGHETLASGEVSAHGSTTTIEMPVCEGEVEYCLQCIGEMTIRCAWCGSTIFIGDPVTLYAASDPGYEPPDYAVYYDEAHRLLVGCLGWDCAVTGADRAGFWVPGPDGAGHVHRVLSPIERAMLTGNPVFVSDVADPFRDVEIELRP